MVKEQLVKFKNKVTGQVLTPKNDMVKEQLVKSDLFELVGSEKQDLSYKELKAKADELEIEYAHNISKSSLIELIENAK